MAQPLNQSNDLGCTIWDIAVYGTNEILLSKVRNEVFLSFSKFGIDNSEFKAELVEEGKSNILVFLNVPEKLFDVLIKVHPIVEVQIEYSSWILDIETNGIMEAYHEIDVTIVVYSPFGRRFLTENLSLSMIKFIPYFQAKYPYKKSQEDIDIEKFLI
ncbi:hypothetical protein C1646_752118 [Rhizophagus diaphanus]|nr:hypothetical protein C1646_752118 [Rhizophagus diaphanus] [Rhizophagus sp. MUCL 43196]